MRWIVIYVCMLHFVWGVGLIFYTTSISQITPLSATVLLLETPEIAGAVLFGVSVLALWEIVHPLKNKLLGLILVMPQQCFALLAASEAIMSALTNTYPDGYSPVFGGFIFFDQLPSIFVAVFHTMAIIDNYFFQYK